MKTTALAFLALGAGAALLGSCAGKKDNGGTVPILSSSADPATAAAAARAEAQAQVEEKMKAPIKANEFTLTITPDPDVASANAIPVHILSLRSDQVAQYKTLGADNYWKSPGSGHEQRVFGSAGIRGASAVPVPFREGQDTVLVIAKLPPSAGGGDARMIEIPLKRQAGADPLNPTAPPLSVRLTRIGLLPN